MTGSRATFFKNKIGVTVSSLSSLLPFVFRNQVIEEVIIVYILKLSNFLLSINTVEHYGFTGFLCSGVTDFSVLKISYDCMFYISRSRFTGLLGYNFHNLFEIFPTKLVWLTC